MSRTGLAVLFLTLAAATAWSQSVIMRSQPLRFTVAKGVNSSNAVALTVVTASLPTPLVNLAVTGTPGSGNAQAFLSQPLINSNGTTTVILSLTNDSTIAVGSYDLAVVASGDASYRLPVPVTVTYVWGGGSFTNGVSTNWAATGNWQGGVVPGPTDDVVFRDMGGVTNAANGDTAKLNTPTIDTNIIVSSDTTVGSIRFAQESNTNQAYHIEIQSGATLSVTGPKGFRIMRDNKFNGTQFGAKFSGGGKLLISHPNAVIAHILDAQPAVGLWDMRALNSFETDVSRLALGDFREFPNYSTNGSVGQGSGVANFASRFVPAIYLALTNVIKASYVDPDNYLNPGIRNYALTLGNNEAQGTTSNMRFVLGLSNAFFLDSICFGQSGSGGSGNLYNFNATNSYALFRGIGGLSSRMSVWVQGDPAGTINSGSNVRGVGVDFVNGQIDALVDRLYLGRSRTNTAGMTVQGTLTIGGAYPGSIFDVNTAILGYQEADNLGTGASAVSGPAGTINVNSNATLKVNGTLHLGYTVATASGLPTYPENCAGTLNINNSGTVMASNILAGGVTKLSVTRNISVNNSGRLIVTNQLGTADGPLNSLTLANNAQLTLHGVAVGQTTVYCKTFSAASACTINIPAIAGYVSGTVTIPLISYVTPSPVISGLSIIPPPGLYFLTANDNGAGIINVTFGNRVPQTVVWRGTTDVWDTSTLNWVTQIGSITTNFNDGDSVVFDDSVGGGSTTVNIIGTVAPGQVFAANGIVVSNNNYTFASGTISGSATLRKAGTGTVTINAILSPGVLLAQGGLAGNGTVGPTTLQNGTTMTAFSGTINGGLTASNATVTVSGTVNGGLTVQAGSLANVGTVNGTITLTTNNVLLNNLIGGNLYASVPWSVPTNAMLINNGMIRQYAPGGVVNAGLTVNGSLLGRGIISSFGTNAIADVRVTMGAGGTLQIGNSPNEITNLTIAVRLDLINTSTTTFDVNNSTFVNDQILLTEGFNFGKVNFGAGNGLGGTLFINRIAGPQFNLATTIYPFNLVANIPDNAQPAIPQIIPTPAPGLVWNTAAVISNLTLTVTGPPFMTNYVGTATNGTRSLVFTWPSDYRGWRLEQQTNSLAVGLESPSTNWTTVFTGLGGTNSLYYPDITNAPNDFYYRSEVTISTTNSGVVYPAAFYRLNYP
jgi:hypothetical protein